MYANTAEGSSALLVCDEDGVVVEDVSYSLSERAPILEQINEHYGTSFTGWSDNEFGLMIGDIVPSWAEYEKIEKQIPLGRYLVYDIDVGCLYDMSENGLSIYAQSNSEAYCIKTDGTVTDETIPIAEVAVRYQIHRLNEMFGTSYTTESIPRIITQWQTGFNVEEIGEFQLIEQ